MVSNSSSYLNEVVRDIGRESNMDDSSGELRSIFFAFIKKFIHELHQIKTFANLFQKVVYTGSGFNGLKTETADEFDLNFVLKLPINYNLIDVVVKKTPAGYMKINLGRAQKSLEKPELKSLIHLDHDFNLRTSFFLRWMESQVVKVLNKFNGYLFILDTDVTVSYSKSGPSIVVILEMSDKEISIDLVPVLMFDKHHRPGAPVEPNYVPSISSWYAVPKPNPRHNSDIYWRMSFPEQEDQMLSGKNLLKPTIRIMKVLRDKWGATFLHSYYIKTLFLWHIRQHKTTNWMRNEGDLLIMMLKELQQATDKKKLLFFWNRNCNFFDAENVNPLTLDNLSCRIERLLRNIETLKGDESQLRNLFY